MLFYIITHTSKTSKLFHVTVKVCTSQFHLVIRDSVTKVLKMKLYSNRLSQRVLLPILIFLFIILIKMHLDSLDFFIELRDIVDDGPDNSENIFFIDVENIDAADSVKSLNIRQLCSIESAGMGKN
ncbi:hypothetical protein ACKWTF_003498 [Chironomus riparius]